MQFLRRLVVRPFLTPCEREAQDELIFSIRAINSELHVRELQSRLVGEKYNPAAALYLYYLNDQRYSELMEMTLDDLNAFKLNSQRMAGSLSEIRKVVEQMTSNGSS
jgi:hypothetical protein